MKPISKDIYKELYSHSEGKRVINTHCHHREDPFHSGLDLDTLLRDSYVNWCGVPFDTTFVSRSSYLNKLRYNSYFIWLEKALQKLYGFEGPITAQNWDSVSEVIQKANSQPGYHLDLLRDVCGYESIVLDAYWNPGTSNNHPGLFTPTFRINCFLYGYSPDSFDHNGNSPSRLFGMASSDLDEYMASMKKIIIDKKASGCIALKSALAYDRGLDFEEVTRDRAEKVLKGACGGLSPEDVKAFGDYVFFEICRIAAELDLPLQCHTGLGQLRRTNAIHLQEVMERNPDTKFVLFHGGYPWMDDILALAHNYPNVYPDLCWLPLISTSAAIRMTAELIEVAAADKVCWGCDTWTSEESFGALLAARHTLASALAVKVEEGYFSMEDAKIVMDNILYNNAKELYYH